MAPEAMDGLVLWGIGTSRTLRAHWALRELGLDYQSRPIQSRTGETKTPEKDRKKAADQEAKR